jgi:hypothetical protein
VGAGVGDKTPSAEKAEKVNCQGVRVGCAGALIFDFWFLRARVWIGWGVRSATTT